MGNHVLVIDDSPTVCKIIELCLRRAGYEVKSFSSGELAIQWLRSPQARIPNLMLVDLCLPRMDGYSVIRSLRAQSVFRQIPFVIISRQDGLIDKLKGKLVGAAAYLTKPLITEDLLSVVKTYLGIVV